MGELFVAKKNTHVIENDKLRVGLCSLGAELLSLQDKVNNRELLWQGDPAVWDGQAPLLFPMVGRLKTGGFTHEGKRHEIGIHGFARFMEFQAVQESATAVSFTFASNAETRAQYPFDFTLTVRWSLDGGTLLKEHITTNTGRGDMWYEVGGHEGYRLPLLDGEKMGDYWLAFDGVDALHPFVNDDDKMILDQKREVKLDRGRLRLDMGHFANDALILDDFAKNKNKRKVELHGPKTGRLLTVTFPDFDYLCLWTMWLPFDTNYICIEPSSALPDFLRLGTELTEKIGIRRLLPGQHERLAYAVEVG